VHNKTRNMH